MSDFIATAEALRIVRKAQEKFLALWALECMMDSAGALEHISMDMQVEETMPRHKRKSEGRHRSEG